MRRRGAAAAVVVMVTATGCMRTVTLSTVELTPSSSSMDVPLRNATNLPQVFTVLRAAASAADCPPQLSDPGLGTVLTLRRSVVVPVQDSAGVHHRAIGDYSLVPPNRYGAGPDDGLRVDCTRLRAIGVVPLREQADHGTRRP